jgi:hypothetical protein
MMFWKSSKRARARASASSTHAVGSSANVRGDGDEIPRTASPGLMEQELLDQVNFDHCEIFFGRFLPDQLHTLFPAFSFSVQVLISMTYECNFVQTSFLMPLMSP